MPLVRIVTGVSYAEVAGSDLLKECMIQAEDNIKAITIEMIPITLINKKPFC